MRHTVKDRPNGVVVQLYGDVDLETSPAVRDILLDSVGRKRDVFVDLSNVNDIDPSGVATLIEAFQEAQRNQVGFALVSVGSAAMQVLELDRLDEVFTIRDALPENLNDAEN
jgi:anti-sigma B factor antagonist